jgi:hypothetical protein
MMDYYQELGLDRTASGEEIRQAYHGLVRLLHPDVCGDGPARRLADLQMKRLNDVVKVLTDPAERAGYDRRLAVPLPAAIPYRIQRPPGHPWWIGIAATILCAAVVFLRKPPPSAPQYNPPAGIAAAPPVTPMRTSRTSKPSLTIRDVHPNSEPLEIVPPIPSNRPVMPDSTVVRASAPDILPPGLPQAPAPAHETTLTAPPGMAGEWLFVPSARARPGALYPPEYIEMRITEEAGVLRGRYRARYHVADQAISPTVAFEFEGPVGTGGVRLPWSGPGGATGDVSLRLLDNAQMEVTWVATQIGRDFGLISGTAALIRRQD